MTGTATRAVHAFDAIGTRWRIETDSPLAASTTAAVASLVGAYDRTWSRFRSDSLVAAIAGGGSADFGPDADTLLPLLMDLSARTGGALTPLIGTSLAHLGYDPQLAFDVRDGYLPAPAADVLGVADGRVTLTAPAVLDVGAAGKGQLVDRVAALLEGDGHGDALVDASGDLRSGAAVRVALEHPFDPAAAIGVVEVAGAALAGSATQRRAWTGPDGRRLHHVLDGRTGRPVDTVVATWALAADAMTADALATALFFLPPEALGDYGFRFVRMLSDGRAHWSEDLPGEMFVA